MPNTYIAGEDIKEGDEVEVLPHVTFSKNPYKKGVGRPINVEGLGGRVVVASTEGTSPPSEGDIVIFLPLGSKEGAELAVKRLVDKED